MIIATKQTTNTKNDDGIQIKGRNADLKYSFYMLAKPFTYEIDAGSERCFR